jgi:hypothetical protein
VRIEEALAAKLRSTPGVSALVGSRIYPARAPQGTTAAYVVYDLLGGENVSAHDGFGGLRSGRISFACCAPKYGEAKAVAEAVRLALAGWRGTLGGLDVSIPQAFEDEDLWDDTLSLYVIVVDFELFWRGQSPATQSAQ